MVLIQKSYYMNKWESKSVSLLRFQALIVEFRYRDRWNPSDAVIAYCFFTENLKRDK